MCPVKAALTWPSAAEAVKEQYPRHSGFHALLQPRKDALCGLDDVTVKSSSGRKTLLFTALPACDYQCRCHSPIMATDIVSSPDSVNLWIRRGVAPLTYRQPAGKFLRDLIQSHPFSRACRAFNLEIIAVKLIQVQQTAE